MCKVASFSAVISEFQPLHISHCILIESDRSWKVFVNGHSVDCQRAALLSEIPQHLDLIAALKLLTILDSANVCHGYPNKGYIDFANSRKGSFRDKEGRVRAYLDSLHPVIKKGNVHRYTIRTTECTLLSQSSLCNFCKDYGPVLRVTYHRWLGKSDEVSKFTNNRYLTSMEKNAKLSELQKKIIRGQKEKAAMMARIDYLTARSGIEVEQSFHQDLMTIMQDNSHVIAEQFPEGTFR